MRLDALMMGHVALLRHYSYSYSLPYRANVGSVAQQELVGISLVMFDRVSVSNGSVATGIQLPVSR